MRTLSTPPSGRTNTCASDSVPPVKPDAGNEASPTASTSILRSNVWAGGSKRLSAARRSRFT